MDVEICRDIYTFVCAYACISNGQHAGFFISIKPISILRLKFVLKVSIFKAYSHAEKYP